MRKFRKPRIVSALSDDDVRDLVSAYILSELRKSPISWVVIHPGRMVGNALNEAELNGYFRTNFSGEEEFRVQRLDSDILEWLERNGLVEFRDKTLNDGVQARITDDGVIKFDSGELPFGITKYLRSEKTARAAGKNIMRKVGSAFDWFMRHPYWSAIGVLLAVLLWFIGRAIT